MNKKKILIFGHYGGINWGDECILSGILSQLDTSRFDVTVVSDNPKYTHKHHNVKGIYPPPFGIRSLFRGGLFDFISVLKKTDYIIIGGGGLFQNKPPFALRLWEYYLQWCTWSKKKIFILGNSFEPFGRNVSLISLQKKFGMVRFFSVRDSHSAEILKSVFQVPMSRIACSADAAYFLEKSTNVSISNKKKTILLSLREGEIPREKEKALIGIIFSVFSEEYSNNQIEVLCMQSKNAGDEKLALRYGLKCDFPKSQEELFTKIASAKFVLGSRLHANILANINHTPFLALAMRAKISQYFGNEFSVSLDDLLSNKGRIILSSIKNDPDAYLHEQNHFLGKQREKLQWFFPDVLVS